MHALQFETCAENLCCIQFLYIVMLWQSLFLFLLWNGFLKARFVVNYLLTDLGPSYFIEVIVYSPEFSYFPFRVFLLFLGIIWFLPCVFWNIFRLIFMHTSSFCAHRDTHANTYALVPTDLALIIFHLRRGSVPWACRFLQDHKYIRFVELDVFPLGSKCHLYRSRA